MTDPIQDSQHGELLDAQPAIRSGVKIATTAKGFAQVTVSVYEDTTEEQMETAKDLAVRTYDKTIAMLGTRASLS